MYQQAVHVQFITMYLSHAHIYVRRRDGYVHTCYYIHFANLAHMCSSYTIRSKQKQHLFYYNQIIHTFKNKIIIFFSIHIK